ncbi:MAG: enoyl-CoA hydratase/isomerase family protein [Actinobacteria bacterium]|nr:enoyl-CoA hydratase/isomerase family protein [Actinomycetota bacterium]
MTELVRVDRHSPEVAELVLDDPDHRNALSVALRDRISDHLDELAADPDLKVLVVSGEGPVFCAGFDLKEFERAFTDEVFSTQLWASSDRYHRAVVEFPVFMIAAVAGPAIAGGMDLAVLCDLRVAATTSWFAHPEHAFGEVVYGPLRDLVGGGFARDLAFTGRRVEADEALRIGLVTRVVPAENVRTAALALAEEIAAPPREIVVRMKAKGRRFSSPNPDAGTLDL